MIRENSPLRRPPAALSRRQVLILDGVRYAVDMAEIAYGRLSAHLHAVATSPTEPSVGDIASAMLDAWSIVDSAHRLRDLVANLPGLPNAPWRRILDQRTADVADLRDCVQHQLGEVERLASGGGQLWGYLSWVELQGNHPSGRWHMLAAGSDYVGDSWLFIGPAVLPFSVPPDRIRLNAFGKQIYLARVVEAAALAAGSLENDVSGGALRPVGPPALERRGADAVYVGGVEVLVANSTPPSDSRL
jgi:hypothetical protein